MTDNFHTAATGDSKDEWLTPPTLIKALGPFDLDPCAPVSRPWDMAGQHFTILDNGLAKPWHGRVWLNPPYGRETFKWIARLAEHRSGVALIFARTETAGFHRYVWDMAHAVFFFRDRINFHHANGDRSDRANAPSVLISYSEADTLAIGAASLKGKLVRLEGRMNAGDVTMTTKPHDDSREVQTEPPSSVRGAATAAGEAVADVYQGGDLRWLNTEAGREAAARLKDGTKLYTAPPEQGWREIESAPRDGTWILGGWFNARGQWCVQRVQWFDLKEWWVAEGYGSGVSFCATHWTPLPAPPAMKAAPPQEKKP